MVQRLTYRKRHSYATKSNQHRIVKTPGMCPFLLFSLSDLFFECILFLSQLCSLICCQNYVLLLLFGVLTHGYASGGKLVYQSTKKRASGPKCPVTGKRIQGVCSMCYLRLKFIVKNSIYNLGKC